MARVRDGADAGEEHRFAGGIDEPPLAGGVARRAVEPRVRRGGAALALAAGRSGSWQGLAVLPSCRKGERRICRTCGQIFEVADEAVELEGGTAGCDVAGGQTVAETKEDRARFKERLGVAGCPRPKGSLIWMHGASVGECLSMLPLIQRLLEKDKSLSIMVTSGTVTSARLMAKRLPERAFHHYFPIDFPGATNRLIRHFQPDVVFWFESEFWPNALDSFKKHHIPLVLLNGRISDRSFKRWKKFPFVIKALLSCFSLTLGQSPENEERLKKLGSPATGCVGNIKCASPASPYSEKELAHFKKQLVNRPCWCGASTHANEEEMMANIHLNLAPDFPGLLTICVPF